MGLIDIRRRILADSPVLAEASGSIASFNTDMAAPLKACQFSIEPVQSGSGDPSPSNVRPISGWTGMAGQRAGKNLYNPAKKTDGSFIAANGKRTSNDTCSFSEAIPVEFGETLTFSGISGKDGENRKRILMFQDDVVPAVGSFFNTAGSPHEETVTGIGTSYTMTCKIIDARAKYVRISFNTADTNVQLEKSSSATAYAPYTGEQIAVEFPAQGKNLLDITRTDKLNPGASGSTITIENEVISVDAVANSAHTYVLFSQELSAGSYTIKALRSGSVGTPRLLTSTQISGSGYNGYYGMYAKSMTNDAVSFTISEPTKIGLVLSNISSETGNPGTLYNIQLEEGSTATAYEPYTNTVYGGTVDPTTGVLTVTHAGYTLDGSDADGWSRFNTTNTYYISNPQKMSQVFLCNEFKCEQPRSASNLNDLCCAMTSSPHNYIHFKKSDITTLEDWKAYVTANPITIVMELVTPITYQLTPQQITALKGMNNVWCDTGNTSVKYWKH